MDENVSYNTTRARRGNTKGKYLIMRYPLTILFTMLLSWASAQLNNQWPLRLWYYMDTLPVIGLDFNNTSLDTIRLKTSLDYFMNSSTICNAQGQLVFTTNGFSVANSQNGMIENGDTLLNTYVAQLGNDASSLPQGTVILNTSQPEKFILLHMDGAYIEPHFTEAAWLPYDEQPLHVYANLVDMSYNDGQGRIETTIPIVSDTLIEGQLAACRHANGRDWWVLTHEYARNNYYITRINEQLQFETKLQTIGTEHAVSDPAGQACFSPDGSKYCMATLKGGKKENPSLTDNSVSIFDFDRCEGVLSNWREKQIPNNQIIHGCQFSASGNFLYIACGGKVFQYELATDSLRLIQPMDTIPLADYQLMQLAPDGKIYMGTGYTYLSAIEHPDELGDSCHLMTKAYEVGYYFYTVPTYPNYYLGALDNSVCDTLGLAIPPLAAESSVIELYPTPATTQLTIQTNNAEIEEVNIYNATGSLVRAAQPRTNKYLLPIETLPAGVYIAEVKTQQSSVRKRWVKM